MEDQGLQSPETLLVKNFFFLQSEHFQESFQCRLQIENSFLDYTNKNGNVMYIITLKLNSTFGMIGIAMKRFLCCSLNENLS